MDRAKPLTVEEETLWRMQCQLYQKGLSGHELLGGADRLWATLDAARAEIERLRNVLADVLVVPGSLAEAVYDNDPEFSVCLEIESMQRSIASEIREALAQGARDRNACEENQ